MDPKWDWGGSAASTVCFGENLIKPKMWHTNALVGVKTFLACNHKDLGPMCFWGHGQSFPGKVFKMKVVEHLPNSKMGQLTQGREPHMGSGQLCSL